MSCCLYLIHSCDRCCHRCLKQAFRILKCVIVKLTKYLNCMIQYFFDSVSVGSTISASSTISGKYIVGGWIPLSRSPFAISIAENSCFLFQICNTHYEFVHTYLVIRHCIKVFQFVHHVICIQNCILARFRNTFASQCLHISKCFYDDCKFP